MPTCVLNDNFIFSVDKAFVEKQKNILSLFYNVEQVDPKAEYYKVATTYDIKANVDNYTVRQTIFLCF